ncbi:MAG: sporulation transcription factor Spo0A [Clostridia bacterium]
MKNKVLICDDNIEFATSLSKYCQKQLDFELVGVAHDGLEACEMMVASNPDFIILDIIMPKLDGLGVLEKVNAHYTKNRPTIIILSTVGREKITQRALDLGAEYFVIKPFEIEVLFTRLRQLRDFSGSSEKIVKLKNENSLGVVLDNDIEFLVTQILLDLGFPAHINGYNFLRDAIIISLEDFNFVSNITKNLYPKVALQYQTTPSRVERSIRHAIEVAWTRGDAQKFDKILGYSLVDGRPKPTNSEFIAMVSDKLRLQSK